MKIKYYLLFLLALVLYSCSPSKFIPDGEYLLDEVSVSSDNKDVKGQSMKSYLRQHPNSKWFSLIKIPLYTYCLSGKDSTKRFNRFLQRVGEAPVIYNESDAGKSRVEIEKAVRNLGYIRGSVDMVTIKDKDRLKLKYHIHTDRPYTIESVRLDTKDSTVLDIVMNDTVNTLLKTGDNFNINTLEAERNRITSLLNNSGYYKFNKDMITYTADTVLNSFNVGVTCNIMPFPDKSNEKPGQHPKYRIGNIFLLTDITRQVDSETNLNDFKTDEYYGYRFIYKDKLFLRPKSLIDNIYIKSGDIYKESNVEKTYQSLGRMSALKYSNIYFRERDEKDSLLLDCFIMLNKNKIKTLSFEIEGTNSAGDLGAAASATFQHRNIFKGSETFMLKIRGAYEAISGLGEGFLNDNYTEYGAEASLNFPRFLMPFLASDFKRKIRATSEVSLMYSNQLRPEFERTLASVSWRYKWTNDMRFQHRVDMIDINYVYVPWISDSFKQQLEQETSSVLKYSYENLFIVRAAYNLNFNDKGFSQGLNNTSQNDSYSIRIGFESAGNLLYGISNLFNLQQVDNKYSIFKIPYAQYVKGDFDFVKNVIFDDRNTFVFHIGLGIAYPYGNSEILPFEKRYFSGGANSVRGWSVRSLGPGSFRSQGKDIDFMLQSGDLKFDINFEYRTKLFWKLQGAAYIDAGNIWTIRKYEDQPGGDFRLNRFYKEIAVSYGLGLRLDFNFFVLRFDTGMKAIDPTGTGKDKFNIIHPDFRRDFAFHFAVGYPF